MKIANIYYLGVFLLGISILLKFFQNIDIQILYLFNYLFVSDSLLSIVTEMGNSFFIISFLVPLFSYLSFAIKKLNYVAPSTLIIPGALFGLIIQAIKNVLNFPRPGGIEGIDINFLNPVYQSLSYPSGHAASILFFGIWWSRLAMGNKFHLIRYLIFCLISLIALSRVIVGAHWLSDVIASYAFTLLYIKIIHKEKIIHFLNKNNYLNIASALVIVTALYSVFNFEVFDHI